MDRTQNIGQQNTFFQYRIWNFVNLSDKNIQFLRYRSILVCLEVATRILFSSLYNSGQCYMGKKENKRQFYISDPCFYLCAKIQLCELAV